MTQPFDNRDWDIRQIEEKDQEIERLKADLRNRFEDRKMDLQEIRILKALCARAADALEGITQYYGSSAPSVELIPELREAAK